MDKIKLFFLPFAGGSATVYNTWKKNLGENIEVIPLELPGRCTRINEKLCEDMESVIADVSKLIESKIDGSKFAIFGHSMGAILTYEICKKLKDDGYDEPVWVFLSGRNAPSVKINRKDVHSLPLKEFKDEILSLGATNEIIFTNEELSKIFIPILRADFKIVENYEYKESNYKFNCNVTAFSGKYDKLASLEEIKQWSLFTNKEFNVYEFKSGHFFIDEFKKDVTNIIKKQLKVL